MIAAFTTDIPALSNWGEPLLVGPGSIHMAHTEGEYVEKEQLHAAVDLYCSIARRLLSECRVRSRMQKLETQAASSRCCV